MLPKIILPNQIQNQMQFYVDNCDDEISGLGSVVFDKEYNGYVVKKIILLDQEVGSAHTDLDDKAVAKAVYEHAVSGDEGELSFWWHSHVNMATFWSTQDHETMDGIGDGGLCVAIVANKKGEMRGAVIMHPEGYPAIKLDDVAIEVEYPVSLNTQELLSEIEAKVRKKSYITTGIASSQRAGILHTNTEDISKAEEKFYRDKWSRLTKEERKAFVNFEDFIEEQLWGAYLTDRTGNVV